MRSRRLRFALGAVVLTSICVSWPMAGYARGFLTAGPSRSRPTPVRLTVDLAVRDAAGRVPATVAPSDVVVTVAGQGRIITWIRRVSRGPGALADAAARRDRGGPGNPGISFVAEPSRTVLLLIDEGSLPMGGERLAVQSAAAFLDRLGMDDRVAVVRLPLATNQVPALTVDRAGQRDAVNRIAGRIAPEGIRIRRNHAQTPRT